MIYIVLYLAVIVAANLLVVRFGPSISILNAFLFIGLDLVARDALHDKWHGRHLVRNMALLIAAGSLLSWFLNRDAGQIALASFLAFSAAAVTDTAFYHLLRKRPRWVKMNGSNIPAALVDSIVFPLVAFGWPPLLVIMAGQFLAKVAGGAVWSVVIIRFQPRNNKLAQETPMIFETLNESAQRGELLLIDGGFCHWHLRRDGQLTIREIISTRPGAGSEMLFRLKLNPHASSIFAKCPADLPANGWYEKMGFTYEGTEITKSGRELRLWRLYQS